jgi:thiamine biosynthesis lipoprotein
MRYKYVSTLIATALISLVAGCSGKTGETEQVKEEYTEQGITETSEKINVKSSNIINSKAEKVTHVDFAMGTVINETIYTTGDDVTGDIILELISLENDLLSWRVEESQIAMVNKEAGNPDGVNVSDTTREYLETVLEVSKRSGGALDPTIGKISRLWDIGGENPRVPSDSEIQELLEGVGYEDIVIKGNNIYLSENSSIDLGAVGKGIGADAAYAYLKQHEEIQGAVISVGGSLVTYGTKPDESLWSVAITNPRKEEEGHMGVLALEGGYFVSTSGDYEKFLEKDGIFYHHILDPKTGYSARSGLISVTIICDNGLLSDALSTACFVLGLEKGMELAESYHAEAVFIDDAGQVHMTEGIKDKFTLVNEEYTIIE